MLGLIPLLVPMEGGGEELSGWPPGVHSFDSRPLMPGVLPDWVNNHALQAVIAAALVIGFWLWMARGQQVVPSKKQFLGEQLYNLLRNTIARDILGHDYRKFLPYLVALFSFCLLYTSPSPRD